MDHFQREKERPFWKGLCRYLLSGVPPSMSADQPSHLEPSLPPLSPIQ